MIQSFLEWVLAILGIRLLVGSNDAFIAVTHGQQHFFSEVQIAALFAMELKDVCFHNRVDRATFFAKAAKNTFRKIDVVPICAARSIRTNL
jgi:hypothetical protein